MRYLIIPLEGVPFFTEWFQPENHFSDGMKVIDTKYLLYSSDGVTWDEISIDHL